MKSTLVCMAAVVLVFAAQLCDAAVPVMAMHDCLGATTTNTITVASGTSTNGSDVVPLGASSSLSGFVTFTGAGTLTVTVQTRRAGKTVWHTPSIGATCLNAVSAGSHHFPIFIPPCEALRLVYTASGADAGVTDAYAIDQHQ